MMFYKLPEYIKRESEICDKIREASDEYKRFDLEGKDTTEPFRRLEAALEEYWSLRREFVEKSGSLP
jgi:hypothetical protein